MQGRSRRLKKPLLVISKRKKFVIISLLLAFGIFGVQSFYDWQRYVAIGILTLFSVLLTFWALRDDLNKAAWWMVPILPMYFTASVNLFYFLLPEAILTRIILFVLFGVGMYALLLTENIFTVAALRTIQLLRAGQALGFVFSLIISFLLFDTIFSFRLSPLLNSGLVILFSLPICLHGVWTARLDERLGADVWGFSLALAFIMAQGSLFISMWPVTIVIVSLFLVTILYVGLGLIQQSLEGRLFRKTIDEYVRIGIIVFLIVLMVASW